MNDHRGKIYRNTAVSTDAVGAPDDVRGTAAAIDQGTSGEITTAVFSRLIAAVF